MDDYTDWDDINSEDVLEGNTAAFEELFKRNYQALCNYCQGIVAEHDKAEDIVQDVFVYLWNNRSCIDIKVSLKHYLYSSVRHGALKVLKRQLMEQRHSPLLAEFIANLQQTEYTEEEVIEIEKMKKALASLPQQCEAAAEDSPRRQRSEQGEYPPPASLPCALPSQCLHLCSSRPCSQCC